MSDDELSQTRVRINRREIGKKGKARSFTKRQSGKRRGTRMRLIPGVPKRDVIGVPRCIRFHDKHTNSSHFHGATGTRF